MKRTLSVACAAMSLTLAACGPPSGPDGPGAGTPELICGQGASLGAVPDPAWEGNVVLEPVDVDCRWQGTDFPMFRRVHDGALFYRPPFVVVDPPTVDKISDPRGRTLMFDVLMSVPDPVAACRLAEGDPRDLALESARPLPMTNIKLKLESPVASSVCEFGDSTALLSMGDAETVRLKFADRDSARRTIEAIEADPSLVALRAYWQSVGNIRALRCSVDTEAMDDLDRYDIQSIVVSAGAEWPEGVVQVAPDKLPAVTEALADAIDGVLGDFPPRTCPPDTAQTIAVELIASYQGETITAEDTTPRILLTLSDLEHAWLLERLSKDAPLMPVAGEEVVRGSCCNKQCDGCCDERFDCLLPQDQTEQRCGAGEPGVGCVTCEVDQICKDGKCWTPPYMEARYELTFEAVGYDARCGAMEVGGCDMTVSYKLPGDEEWIDHVAPDNHSHPNIGKLLLSGADAETAMQGFDVSVTDRDPFKDDFLGSCTVAVRKQHLAQSFKDPAGVSFDVACGKSYTVVTFHVQISP